MNEEIKETEHPGFEIVRWLKPGGCVLVLLLTAAALLMLLTSGRDPVKGYAPPQTSEYYSGHLDELQIELEENVFPFLDGVESCRESGGVLVVELSGQGYAAARAAILKYYDASLFQFVTP